MTCVPLPCVPVRLRHAPVRKPPAARGSAPPAFARSATLVRLLVHHHNDRSVLIFKPGVDDSLHQHKSVRLPAPAGSSSAGTPSTNGCSRCSTPARAARSIPKSRLSLSRKRRRYPRAARQPPHPSVTLPHFIRSSDCVSSTSLPAQNPNFPWNAW